MSDIKNDYSTVVPAIQEPIETNITSVAVVDPALTSDMQPTAEETRPVVNTSNIDVLHTMLVDSGFPVPLTAEAVQASAVAVPTVSSTSDDRVVNNVMRHAYRVLSDDEKATMQAIKDRGLIIYNHLKVIEDAVTALEATLKNDLGDDVERGDGWVKSTGGVGHHINAFHGVFDAFKETSTSGGVSFPREVELAKDRLDDVTSELKTTFKAGHFTNFKDGLESARVALEEAVMWGVKHITK